MLRGHQGEVNRVRFGRQRTASHILTASEDCTVKVWQLGAAELTPLFTLAGHTTSVCDMAISANGEVKAFGSGSASKVGGFFANLRDSAAGLFGSAVP